MLEAPLTPSGTLPSNEIIVPAQNHPVVRAGPIRFAPQAREPSRVSRPVVSVRHVPRCSGEQAPAYTTSMPAEAWTRVGREMKLTAANPRVNRRPPRLRIRFPTESSTF